MKGFSNIAPSEFALWEDLVYILLAELDCALQVGSYYFIYYELCSCSIKALEFCPRGPYYVTACQLFDFSDQLQFDAQLNKLFVQNFHCNSFFFIGCYTNMNYVWLDKKKEIKTVLEGEKKNLHHIENQKWTDSFCIKFKLMLSIAMRRWFLASSLQFNQL